MNADPKRIIVEYEYPGRLTIYGAYYLDDGQSDAEVEAVFREQKPGATIRKIVRESE